MAEVPTHLKDPCPSRLAGEQALPSTETVMEQSTVGRTVKGKQ